MVFDLTKDNGNDLYQLWNEIIISHCEENPEIILLGNKVDLVRDVETIYLKDSELNCTYTSALTNVGLDVIDNAIQKVVEIQLLEKEFVEVSNTDIVIIGDGNNTRRRRRCCHR